MQKIKILGKPKLLFVVTEDWYFYSHRLPLALEAIKLGFDVAVVTRITDHGDIIRKAGIKTYSWSIFRGSTGIFKELKTLYELLKIYRKFQPDFVHQVSWKPVLYGSLVAKLIGPKKIINALGGMGSIFNNNSKKWRVLKTCILTLFKWILSGQNMLLILQNKDDYALMRSSGVEEKNIRMIRGAGVNLEQFHVSIEPNDVPLIILPARMLWDKGVGEYVEAARILLSEGLIARFALVGGTDDANLSAISRDQLSEWTGAGLVEWFGLREDMPEIFRSANVVCLPSYREGLPKALLEAAACGRAIVTTDVPGCREIVRDGENGILVPARDPVALAAALKKLILDPDLRRQMGRKGRDMVVAEFSEEIVIGETMKIYKELFGIKIIDVVKDMATMKPSVEFIKGGK